MMIDALYNYRQGDIHAAEFFIIHAEFQCCDFSGKMRGAVICFKGSVVGRCAFGIVNCGIKANRTIFRIGFTPVSTRAFGDTEIEPFRSVEWQAKALTGKVMIPYEASKGMTSKAIVEKYHVTKKSADYRVKQDK
ncbi:MAG: hypothetical protein MR434_05615 [Ruminococcus sp.]|nr:hypothetical protein [Ruminococcus sp.]